MRRVISHVGAALLLAGMLGVGTPGVAAACACGGVVSPDTSARIADEEALVAMDGGKEIIVMRLDLRSNADNAALIVPTPAPATVSTTSASLFDELAALSAPRVETRRKWTFSGGAAAEGAPRVGAGPTVVQQVQLGPLEATTLTGGDVSSVQQWLDGHGYTMRPDVVAQLDPYLKQGWAFVAMRLTSTEPLDGPLAPVKLEFSSDRMVYPMRMSAAARTPQRVVVYTLGEHRMQRTDADATSQRVTVEYAGSIEGRARDQALTELSKGGAFLTKIAVNIVTPSAITSDFTFGPAANDDAYQQVVYVDKKTDVTPYVFLGGIALGAVVVLAVVAVVVFVVVRSSRRSPSRRG